MPIQSRRAAKDFSTNGFKSLTMGMQLDVLPSTSYVVSERTTRQRGSKITISRGDLLAIGYHPLRSVGCEFFNGRLYRIDLVRENRKEVLRPFRKDLVCCKRTIPGRAAAKTDGEIGRRQQILRDDPAPGGAYGGEEWDSVVLMDNSIVQEAEQYKQDRAMEAAKEIAANGFKALTMGMSLKSPPGLHGD